MVKGENMKVIEKRKNGSIRVYTVNNEPSMTDQQFKDDCDVNSIVNKFTKTGHLTHRINKKTFKKNKSRRK